MCGRFSLTTSPTKLAGIFRLLEIPHLDPHYNVPPGSQIAAIRQTDHQRTLDYLHWGLIPPCVEDPKTGYETINARALGFWVSRRFLGLYIFFLGALTCIISIGLTETAGARDSSQSVRPNIRTALISVSVVDVLPDSNRLRAVVDMPAIAATSRWSMFFSSLRFRMYSPRVIFHSSVFYGSAYTSPI